MERELKSHFCLYSDHHFRRREEVATLSETELHGPLCLLNSLQVQSGCPRPGLSLQTQASRGCRGSRQKQGAPRRVLRSRWRSSASGQQQTSLRTRALHPPIRVLFRTGLHCWDKRTLLLAFIFSRRFTKWPLLTSSSSVLSSAERSWKQRWKSASFDSSPTENHIDDPDLSRSWKDTHTYRWVCVYFLI